ncbi:MAG: hypothetical protein ACRCUY_00750 [Thermoguttaceae bacterium]
MVIFSIHPPIDIGGFVGRGVPRPRTPAVFNYGRNELPTKTHNSVGVELCSPILNPEWGSDVFDVHVSTKIESRRDSEMQFHGNRILA